jgi:D-tagatose-1,6-bisphosphate aldolase subunit GatZ/KbaZ
VIEVAIQQSLHDGSILHVESTSSQVNQFGGYTGLNPAGFAKFIHSAAARAGLPQEKVLLGGDHLGPFPWRDEPSAAAMEKGCQLVEDCVRAGYQKIHLDASMPCADDTELSESEVARRATRLCRAAEDASAGPEFAARPVYVIGTEVPAPGGEASGAHAPTVTTSSDVDRTLGIFREEFEKAGLSNAWERVIALVVQPGVEFGSNSIFAYDPSKTSVLSASLSNHPKIVFEAHSTDYQTPEALLQMVRDHFAILKVGPWLTFAYREAVLALSAIEHELFQKNNARAISQVRDALVAAMLQEPKQWKSYYKGDEAEIQRDLVYAYSDRCRYYWHVPSVQRELARLFENLGQGEIPLTLISQFLPLGYEAIRDGSLTPTAQDLIRQHIQRVLSVYANACSLNKNALDTKCSASKQ